MKSHLRLWIAVLSAFTFASSAFAGGSSEPSSRVSTQDKGGTNVRGQSGDFKDYLNAGDEDEAESNSVELADLGDGAKLAVGGDDPSLGVKVGY